MAGKQIDLGALEQRVYNLGGGHDDLRKEVRGLESKMDSGFLLLAQKIDQKTTPNWQPISIAVTIMIAIFGALYYPVREALGKHDAALDALRDKTNVEVVRLWDAENRTARDLAYLQGQLHPLVPLPPA